MSGGGADITEIIQTQKNEQQQKQQQEQKQLQEEQSYTFWEKSFLYFAGCLMIYGAAKITMDIMNFFTGGSSSTTAIKMENGSKPFSGADKQYTEYTKSVASVKQ